MIKVDICRSIVKRNTIELSLFAYETGKFYTVLLERNKCFKSQLKGFHIDNFDLFFKKG